MVIDFGHWGKFPPELYLQLLEFLNYSDETARGSITILNLSLLSRSHHELISCWASRVAKDLRSRIMQEEAEGNIPSNNMRPQTCLSILCKRLAGICAVCNCRKDNDELFTGIQLCLTCDAFFFPKITATRFGDLFRVTILGEGNPRNLEFQRRRICPSTIVDAERLESGPIFRWVDLNVLFSEGFYVRRRDQQPTQTAESKVYNMEEYGYFCPPNLKAYSKDYWPKSIVWATACSRWDDALAVSGRDVLRPSVMDMILLREFRYHFDRNWTSKRDLQYEMGEYFKIACHWVNDWGLRPWGLSNLPLRPRSSATDSILQTKHSKAKFDIYQSHCAKLRKVLKIFPDILLVPRLWREYIADETEMPIEAVRSRMAHLSLRPPEYLELIFRNDPYHADVKLMKVTEVQPAELQVYLEMKSKLDLVRIKGDVAEIIAEDKTILT